MTTPSPVADKDTALIHFDGRSMWESGPWTLRIAPGTVFGNLDAAPSWFHRLMGRILLGWRWEKRDVK